MSDENFSDGKSSKNLDLEGLFECLEAIKAVENVEKSSQGVFR